MKHVHKEYSRSFLLEPTKLTRIVDKAHEHLREHSSSVPHDRFEVFLSGNRHEELDNIEEVLALENSRKLRVQRLVVTCAIGTGTGRRPPDHEIQIDFAGPKNAPFPSPP